MTGTEHSDQQEPDTPRTVQLRQQSKYRAHVIKVQAACELKDRKRILTTHMIISSVYLIIPSSALYYATHVY